MANEITQTLTLTALSGNFSASASMTKSRDQTNKLKYDATINVGTSEEVIAFGDLVTPRFMQVTNLDPSNYVRLGPESAGAMVPLARLVPGDSTQIPLEPGVTLRAQANTAPVKIALLALDA